MQNTKYQRNDANCLNACDTPPLTGGPYPAGTYSYYTVPVLSPSGFPAGMKIVVMS